MKKRYIVLTVALAVVIAGGITFGGISWASTANMLGNYKSQLDYVYRMNFYELVDNVNDIESDLGKLSVTTNNNNASKYVSNILNASSSAQNNITQLPLNHQTIDNTIQFINQLGGFMYSLQTQMSSGDSLSLDDIDQIENLHSSAENVKYELNKLSVLISNGNYSIIDNIQDPNVAGNAFSDEWSGLNNNTIEYPSLIYDGPFSDSTTNKTIQGLSESEISATDAEIRLKNWFNGYTITSNGEVNGGEFDVYNFTLTKNDEELYAQITKRDGILLQLNSGEVSKSKDKSLSECESLSVEFASKLGFEDMVVAWSTSSNNFAYINLTPVQNDVILYPDLIKVKVSQETGSVVGWEAKSWAYNHRERANLDASIDSLQARMAVSESMDIRTDRLTLIPGDFVGEILAYEFMCVYSGSTYYVYIDANTGEQCNVLKVVETDDGNLLM